MKRLPALALALAGLAVAAPTFAQSKFTLRCTPAAARSAMT